MLREIRSVARGNDGVALVYSLCLLLVCSALMAGGANLVLSTTRGASLHQTRSQAESVARAGFRDAVLWFRNNSAQPVDTFNPGFDDSEAPEIGLVKCFPISISEGLWGRYEVLNCRVRDMTERRGKAGAGVTWEVPVVGYVYKAVDPSKGFTEWPNRVLARTSMVGEISRLGLSLPPAAIISYEGKHMVINKKAEVLGGEEGSGAAGLLCRGGTGNPNVKGEVYGDPPEVALEGLDIEMETVFGAGEQELKAVVDYVVSHVKELPSPLPRLSLVYVDGNATFTSSRPLVGSGLLVVDGNMTMAANSYSDYAGVIYVTGKYNGSAPGNITGTLVVRGHVNISGGPTVSEVQYSDEVVEAVAKCLSQYRETKSVHVSIRQ
jgi:hypothetical protein